MIEEIHSEMTFGRFREDDFFDIEKSEQFKKIEGNGFKPVEFLLLRKVGDENFLVFVEAKRSSVGILGYEGEKIENIAQKFKDSLQLFSNIICGYNENSILPSNYSDFLAIKPQIVFRLVVKYIDKGDRLLAQDKLENLLKKEMVLWNIDIKVFDEDIARKRNLVI